MIEIKVNLENIFLHGETFAWRVPEHINHFSQTFMGGKIYGIVGELGDGAWSIAHLLTGQISLRQFSQSSDVNTILFNGKFVNQKQLKQSSCILKFGIKENEKKRFRKEKTVRQQIQGGLAKNKIDHSFEEIVKTFQLTEGRLDRPLRMYSSEGWRASLAVGIANGKIVFGSPWLTPSYLHYIGSGKFQKYFEFIKNSGAMIILPTNKTSWVESMADELIFMENTWKSMLPPELAK